MPKSEDGIWDWDKGKENELNLGIQPRSDFSEGYATLQTDD